MGPSPDLLDRSDYTPLHWAAYNGHDNCVELLLDQDKRNSPDFIGNRFSPLHCAVSVHCFAFKRNFVWLFFNISCCFLFSVYSINGYDTCTELLLENKGSSIVSLVDSKGR